MHAAFSLDRKVILRSGLTHYCDNLVRFSAAAVIMHESYKYIAEVASLAQLLAPVELAYSCNYLCVHNHCSK